MLRSRFAVFAVLGFLAVGLPQARAADVEGGQDHPLVPERFTGAVIEKYEAKPFDEYFLLTGPLVRVGLGSNRKEGEGIPLEGPLTRIIYRIPKGPSTVQVVRNYELLLEKQGFQPIAAISNGEGLHQWDAADIVSRLRDRADALKWLMFHIEDRYYAAKRATPEGEAYVSLAVAQDSSNSAEKRGSIVVLLEIIEVKALAATMEKIDAAGMQKDITETGRVALYGIYFDFDKADVKPESGETLAEIAKLLAGDPQLKLFVVGHTDGKGSHDYNRTLSQRRAEAVVAALVSGHGIASERLFPVGVGMFAPVATNLTEEGRAKNRRVELVQRIQ